MGRCTQARRVGCLPRASVPRLGWFRVSWHPMDMVPCCLAYDDVAVTEMDPLLQTPSKARLTSELFYHESGG